MVSRTPSFGRIAMRRKAAALPGKSDTVPLPPCYIAPVPMGSSSLSSSSIHASSHASSKEAAALARMERLINRVHQPARQILPAPPTPTSPPKSSDVVAALSEVASPRRSPSLDDDDWAASDD